MKRLMIVCMMSFAVFVQTHGAVTKAQFASGATGFCNTAFDSIGKAVVTGIGSLFLYKSLGENTRLLHNLNFSRLYAGLVAVPVLSGGTVIATNSVYGIKKSYSKINDRSVSDEKKAKHIGSIAAHFALLGGFIWYANKFKSPIATFLSWPSSLAASGE